MPENEQQSRIQVRQRLAQHFTDFQGEKYSEGWEKLWSEKSFLPWDKGVPSPALEEALSQKTELIGRPLVDVSGTQQRKTALVPGCGRGVDVLLLASFGYDAVGLECSPSAVVECIKFQEEHTSDYPVRDGSVGRGRATFVAGDFFKDDWWEESEYSGKFDLIYDYTFFCALPPSMRPKWSRRMSELLSPSPWANLICLEFPVTKSPSTGGPPYGSPSQAYMEHLSHPGEDVPYDTHGAIIINPLRERSYGGLERVAYWHPEETHDVGKDERGNVQDYVSVWRHH